MRNPAYAAFSALEAIHGSRNTQMQCSTSHCCCNEKANTMGHTDAPIIEIL